MDFGLLKAKSGIDCYYILRKTHTEAIKKGVPVTYKGIEKIDLEIPVDATPIKLSAETDFEGVTIDVLNKQKELYLFEYIASSSEIDIDKSLIDKGNFRSISQLRNGRYLLVITDNNKWVDNRKGYSYGHIRNDILLVDDGKAVNSVVRPYDNINSSPSCRYYKATDTPISIKNLTLNRNPHSTEKTYFVRITGCDNIQIENVTVNTQTDGTLVSDAILNISDCTNVSFTNVSLNGSYSRTDYSGYGISMNNIWNFRADNLYANANWGIFGTNNVSDVVIRNSDINRFDIHCYGRNVRFENTIFRNLYNQFSSVYGMIEFRKCHFIDFTPVLIESSYNSFVPFSLSFFDCKWDITSKHCYLVYLGNVGNVTNARPELSEKYLPNVCIEKLKINVSEQVDKAFLFVGCNSIPLSYRMENNPIVNITGLANNGNSLREFLISDSKVVNRIKTKLSVRRSDLKVVNH